MKIEVDLEGKRADIYLSLKTGLSRSKIQKSEIFVNGKKVNPSYKVQIGDIIEFEEIKEDFIPKAKNIPLNIFYEDKDLIVLNKQKGLICHPTSFKEDNTLVNALLYHCKTLSDIEGLQRQGIVHRLDKNTSGLMLAAKNNSAHIFLKKDIQEKKTVRKYLAICHGIIKEDEGEINKPLVHYLGKTVKMNVADEGLEAVTKFKVLERFNCATFLELELKTGRTHQIRCHMAYLNHPLIGDDLYGAGGFRNKALSGLKVQGQVLQSYYLLFTHPSTSEIMEFEIKDFDNDIKKTLNLLRSLK